MKKPSFHEKQPPLLRDAEQRGIIGTLRRVFPFVDDERRKTVLPFITLAVLLGVCVGVVLFLVTVGHEDRVSLTPEDIHVAKISPRDQSAVVKTPEGALTVIRVGDSPSGLGRVIEIVEGRIVIAAQGERGSEEIIIRVHNGVQRVVRIRKVGDAEPPFATSQPAK